MVKKRVTEFQNWFNKVVHFLSVDIWRVSFKDLSLGKTLLIKQLRILILAFRGTREDKVLLRAPALTFYSIFSIIPAVALAFGIAQGFGLEMYVEQQLQIALAGREEVLSWLMELTETFLRQFDGGTLAVVGLIILLYTITMLLVNMEKSFNEIWQVSKGRPWTRKFTDYFAMMFIAPLFFIMAGVATVYLNTQIHEVSGAILNPLLLILVRILPYILIWTVLTLLYIVMPNTNVQFSSALIAGIISGTIFQFVQWAYITFQIGATTYNTLYGSFAALPLLLLWMQVSWIVVLFGAELSYAYHNVDKYEFEAETKNISPFNKKILSLYVLKLLVKNFQKGEAPLTPEEVSKTLQIPNSLVRSILNNLEVVGLVSETRTDHTKKSAYQPAIDIHTISIKMVLERLDKQGMDVLIAKSSPALDAIKNTLQEFYTLLEQSERNKLLKDL